MHILITGASGFIGSHLTRALLKEGHRITAAVRDPETFCARHPDARAVAVDFTRALRPGDWLHALYGVDAAVNAVGIIRETGRQTFQALHQQAPVALFRACRQVGVKRVIQISALGADEGAESRYHLTKRAADDHLADSGLDWTVLRPSIVYGPGARSMTLFKALAALPLTPLVNRGEQPVQPIHVDDLSRAVAQCLRDQGPRRLRIDLVGPEPVCFHELMRQLRLWLGLGRLRPLVVPYRVALLGAKLGGFLGGAPVTPETVRMLVRGNSAPVDGFVRQFGFLPRSLAQSLRDEPARQPDRWQAGLFFLRPLLRVALALTWLSAGIVSAGIHPIGESLAMLNGIGITGPVAAITLYAAAGLDLLLGAATLSDRWLRPALYGQLMTMLLYTLIITALLPAWWAHPFGPVVKNLPIAIATLILLVLQRRPSWTT